MPLYLELDPHSSAALKRTQPRKYQQAAAGLAEEQEPGLTSGPRLLSLDVTQLSRRANPLSLR